MMKDFWYTAVLIFIIFHESTQSGQRQTGLTCVNDYLKNISCVWGNSTDFSAQRCELKGIRHEKLPVSRCELVPVNSHSYSERGCVLTFTMNFIFLDNIILSVTCNGSLITTMEYQPSHNIKTQPPDKPTVSGVNITWSLGVNFPDNINEYEFEVQWKSDDVGWEMATTRHVSHGPDIQLDPNRLTIGEKYQARVRVKPVEPIDDGYLRGQWSDWSPAVSWRSEVGMSETTTNAPPVLPADFRTVLVIVFHILILIIVISLVTYKVTKSRGLKPKQQHIPDPSKYFKPLHTVHGGNFRKWLGGQNSIGPFLNPQSCDEISPVEVSDILEVPFVDPAARMSTTGLLHSGQVDSGLDHSGTSHASSSIFSNMGYFYSKSRSGSFHLETCPVYFTYHPEKDPSSAFSSPGSSYDRLQSPCFQSDDLMSPDSGFDMPEQCEDDKDDTEIIDRDGNALVTFIMSLSQGSLGSVRTTESFHPMPVTVPWPEPVISPIYNPTCEPADSGAVRPSSLIEPCASGYLTLKEMQKYSNKSI